MSKREYGTVVMGSGPNGVSTAIVLAWAGLFVVLEARATIDGGRARPS